MVFENFLKITGLALADAVNPCEIAILTMVLMAILIQNPENRKKVLYAGLAFSGAIFIGYMFYGLVITQFFKVFDVFLKSNTLYLVKGLAIFAMVLGALNIKDFFFYKPGSFLTEMPKFLRPKAKKIIDGITSVKGAFVLGFLLTLFLIPCTMGPYVIASGILSKLGYLALAGFLIYYNLIFILPMIAITLIVYFGFAEVGEVSGWKELNIKKLHLTAGILLFLTGLALLLGWI